MKILHRLTIAEVIADHFGYDDYQGRWWDVWRAKGSDYTAVVANPSGIGNGAWDWMTLGLLVEELGDWEE